MIIFYTFLIFLLFILIFKFKLKIYIQINGVKTYIKIGFYFWKTEIKGDVCYVKKGEKRKFLLKNSKKSILIKRFNDFGVKIKKMGKNNILSRDVLLKVLKNIRIEKLYICEEIGLIEPFATALTIPIISTVTMLPLNFLNVNYRNFNYKLVPIYTDLRFNCSFDFEISFRIIKIIYSIINEILHKLFLKKRR